MPTFEFRQVGVTNAQASDQVGVPVTMSLPEPPITQQATIDNVEDLPALIAGLAAAGLQYVGEV